MIENKPQKMPERRILLMAAGQSRRFGSQKLLHPLADGQPLIVHSLQCARQLAWPVTLVADADQPELRRLLNSLDAEVLPLRHAEEGLGSNLAKAVAACPVSTGWLVMLGDMPLISPETLEKIAEAAAPDVLIVPRFMGQRGHPVWFGARFGDELRGLSGDQGGRRILMAHPRQLIEVPVDDPGVLADIDTPLDLPPGSPDLPRLR